MQKQKQTIQFSLWFLCLLLPFMVVIVLYPLKAKAQETIGIYTSAVIGREEILRFLEFNPQGEVRTPPATDINYQFSSSPDNKTWSAWIKGQFSQKRIDLTSISKEGDKYLKVKISLTSNDPFLSPSLESFQVTYNVQGEGIGGGPGGIETVTETFSASDLLPLTGSNLLVNLLFAIFLAGSITYLIVRHSKRVKKLNFKDIFAKL